MLTVQMLGVHSVSIDGRRNADDLGPTGRIFSGFLFQFAGRVHRRERLADQFWGHLEPERARAALNTALWRVRKLLACDPASAGGRNLRTSGSEVVLEPAPWLDIDTWHFSATVKRLLDHADSSGTSLSASALEDTICLYAGPFLDGEDADWILVERERLRSLYIRVAKELVRRYGCSERYEEAVALSRQLLADDPFRESMHRDLLVLLLLNGQRGEALRQHERWCALLRQELDIEPMPQTVRVADEIRSGKIFERLEALRTGYFAPAESGQRPAPHEPVSRAPRQEPIMFKRPR